MKDKKIIWNVFFYQFIDYVDRKIASKVGFLQVFKKY